MSSIFSLILAIIALPGAYFTCKRMRLSLTEIGVVPERAGLVSFWIVLGMMAIVGLPRLSARLIDGLPAWAVLIEAAPYAIFIIVGGKHLWMWLSPGSKVTHNK